MVLPGGARLTPLTPDSETAGPQGATSGTSFLSGRDILIVDDDPRNLFALSSLLEDEEASVLSAESGREAISMLLDNPGVSAVLMDIMMPDMDGYETMRTIRGWAASRTAPLSP